MHVFTWRRALTLGAVAVLTGKAGSPPKLCFGAAGSVGRRANDENVYTRALSLP